MKPLFIPLYAKHFAAFASGEKGDELRLYGDRYNENTCPIGRDVILSKGYGKIARIQGYIEGFKKVHGSECSPSEQNDLIEIYGKIDVSIARISIKQLAL